MNSSPDCLGFVTEGISDFLNAFTAVFPTAEIRNSPIYLWEYFNGLAEETATSENRALAHLPATQKFITLSFPSCLMQTYVITYKQF